MKTFRIWFIALVWFLLLINAIQGRLYFKNWRTQVWGYYSSSEQGVQHNINDWLSGIKDEISIIDFGYGETADQAYYYSYG